MTVYHTLHTIRFFKTGPVNSRKCSCPATAIIRITRAPVFYRFSESLGQFRRPAQRYLISRQMPSHAPTCPLAGLEGSQSSFHSCSCPVLGLIFIGGSLAYAFATSSLKAPSFRISADFIVFSNKARTICIS